MGDRHGTRRLGDRGSSALYATPDEMAATTDVTEPHIRLALAYYAEFPHEINATIEKRAPPRRASAAVSDDRDARRR